MKKSSFLMCANWKMHKTPESVRDYLRQIKSLVTDSEDKKCFVFFAPALVLFVLREELAGSGFGWGAQNCYFKDEGAFTGETSPLVLRGMGATHCLVGHSERRTLFGESDEDICKKVRALLRHSLTPVICVGESAEERKKGLSFAVVERQLSGVLQIPGFPGDRVYVAYEPVWAIGGGQPAQAEQISKMREHIREVCARAGLSACILYGGSVNEANIKELAQTSGVEGFLAGGASLDPQKFFNMFALLK